MSIYSFFEKSVKSKPAKFLILFFINIIIIPCLMTWTLLGICLFPLGSVYMKFVQGKSAALLTRHCIWIYGRVWQRIFSLFVDFEPIDCKPHQFAHPGIIVVNHRSFFDTYCMNMLPVFDVCFAVRAWPFKLYFYRLFMEMAGYMNIENFSWKKISRMAKRNFTEKSFILFFPEGHRSRNRKLTHFYSGAFKLAIENHAPIIPVCLTGTEDLLPAGRYYLAPARIRMKVLDPVWPDGFEGDLNHLKMKKYVKDLIRKETEQMDGE